MSSASYSQVHPFTIGPDLVSLDLRLAMGRRWMKLMSQLPAALRAKIMARWTVSAPDPASDADVPLVAHPEVHTSYLIAAPQNPSPAEQTTLDETSCNPTHSVVCGLAWGAGKG